MTGRAPDGRRGELASAVSRTQERLARACAAAGRAPAEVTLIAVSKTWPASDAATVADLGVVDLGESRDQEAGPKAAALRGPQPWVRWHFLGRLQRNKARSVASYATVVHSLDRAALVAPLQRGAEEAGRPPPGVLVQVSLDGDLDRGGALQGDVLAVADAAAAAGLPVLGVMAVAPLGADPAAAFGCLHVVSQGLRAEHPGATWISAGMSRDLEPAVAAGTTHVRVGTAIFGSRPPPTG